MITSDSALASLVNAPFAERQARGCVYTPAEIASQPELWRASARLLARESADLASFLGENPRLLLSGAGSSHFVGLSVVPSLRRAVDRAEAIPSTEILMDPESSFPREPFILVSFARSGESPEGNAVVELAERLRPGLVRQLVITCNPHGELARLGGSLGERGKVLLLPEGSNDKGLAMTSSFSSLALAGLFLGYAARWSEASARAFAALTENLASEAESILARFSGTARDLAAQGFARVFFIASRPFLGGAYEAQLKVQELSGGAIVAKAEDTLGLRHGFMAAIDPESLVVLYLSSNEYRRRYELDLARELRAKALGRTTLLVTPESSDCEELGDIVLQAGGKTGDDERALLAVLPGQLLGLFSSLALGLRPDEPSPSGIISRVVQGVIVHPYGTGSR